MDSQPLSVLSLLRLLRDTLFQWNRGKAFVYAAALAFYTIFSIVPLLVLLISMSSGIANAATVEQQILEIIAREAGHVPSEFVGQIIEGGGLHQGRSLAAGLGIVFLIWGSSTIFHQLQNSLNAMYGLPETRDTFRHGALYFLVARMLSAAIVIVMGILFLFLLGVNLVLTALPPTPVEVFFSSFAGTDLLMRMAVVPLLSTLFFAALYKWLPGGQMRWRDVLPGAALTMLLIAGGNWLIRLYLEMVFSASIYGATGTVILFLTWIYYISMILLFGAKFIALYAERYGQPITPKARLFLRNRSMA